MNTLTNFIYSYTCTYYFVSTPNPLAVKPLTNFLLFFKNFLLCLRGSEPAFIVFGLFSFSFVFFTFGIISNTIVNSYFSQYHLILRKSLIIQIQNSRFKINTNNVCQINYI